jgi:hypothetical protein
MNQDQARAKLESIIDDLAAIEHERWSHWQRFVHSNAVRQADGSLIIPPELVAKWNRQIATPYAALSEAEKESDKEQVRKYLPLIASMFAT